ncbi:MAG TPA: sugar-binding protein [Planctomycetaceae bacterium]|nr:sugar-binding protein [Planctomycetaceae bacterium]
MSGRALPLLIGFLVSIALPASPSAADSVKLSSGVRGVATRAPKEMKIDGDLSEFKNAFASPVEYFNADLKNRAAQFFYMWDEDAFYAGLRTLDQKQADQADDDHLWEGDAVEWYFDTRRGGDFRNAAWPTDPIGAVHCYWTGFKNDAIQPRFCLRPGFLQQIPKVGVEVGARKTAQGAEVEFKLPWSNFPKFKAARGEIIAIDAELCYSDGGPRVFRSFVFGSPLSVQQPASLGKVQLVDALEPAHWKQCGAVMMPIRCDTAWTQPVLGQASGSIALPPNHSDQVGKIIFRVADLDGQKLGDFPATTEVIEKAGNFARATANWPIDLAPPGGHQVTAIVYDKSDKELTRVSPRLVSVNMQSGY